MFWSLEPEVAGELGPGGVVDTRPVVSKLEYVLSVWSGDDLIETFPCYVVTERLAKDLESEGFTGFQLDSVTVVRSHELDELQPDRQLPSGDGHSSHR